MTQLAEQRMAIHMRTSRRLRTIAGDAPPWLDALRKAGIARFEPVGFPTTKQEEWRHTQLAPIANTQIRPGRATSDCSGVRMRQPNSASAAMRLANSSSSTATSSPQLSKLGKLPRGVQRREPRASIRNRCHTSSSRISVSMPTSTPIRSSRSTPAFFTTARSSTWPANTTVERPDPPAVLLDRSATSRRSRIRACW